MGRFDRDSAPSSPAAQVTGLPWHDYEGVPRGRLPWPLATLTARFPSLARRLGSSTPSAQFARGAFWTTTGALLAKILSLAAAVILARLLGAAAYGEYGVVVGAVGTFSAVAGAGMGLTATRYIARIGTENPLRAGRILALSNLIALTGGLLTAVVLAALSPRLASGVLAAPRLVPALRISALLLVFYAWNGAQIGALSGMEAFRESAIACVLSAMLLLFGLSVGALAGGVTGTLWGSTAATMGSCVIYRRMLLRIGARRGIRAALEGAFTEWRILVHFSIPSVLATLFVTPVSWAAIAIIARGPGGFAEVGVFTAANQWRALVLFLPNTLAGAALPLLTRASTGSGQGRTRILRLNLLLTGACALLAALVIIAVSPFVMRTYGSGFGQGARVLQVLAASAVIGAILSVVGQLLIVDGRMWWGSVLNVAWGVALLGSTWFLRRHGALGLAIANLVAYGVHFITTTSFVALDRRAPLRPGRLHDSGGGQ